MNNNYFRITAYHGQANVSVIFDSYGYYSAIWQMSAFLVSKSFQIIEVNKDGTFTDGNIPRIQQNSESIVLRACKIGKPDYTGKTLDVHGRHYMPNS